MLAAALRHSHNAPMLENAAEFYSDYAAISMVYIVVLICSRKTPVRDPYGIA